MPNNRTGYNVLTVEVYSGLSTTRRDDTNGDLPRAQDITFETQYPGGLHGPAELFIPRDPTQSWLFTGNDRLVIRNGQSVAWEGTIAGIGYLAGDGADQGRRIIGQGWWGTIFGKRGWEKPWADNRISEDVWRPSASPYNSSDGSGGLGTWDRLSRLKLTPKAVAWGNNKFERLYYAAPTCASVVRINYTDDLNEAAQAWQFRIILDSPASTGASRITSGSSIINYTPGTPTQTVSFLFDSLAAQTPVADGTTYGAACAITVYTTTAASPTASNIGLDIITRANVATASPVNADTTKVTGPTLVLDPFISDGYEMLGDILLRAVGYGDSSASAWAAYLDHSETAQTPNGTPVLNQAVYPALTDYDYAVRFDDPNVVPPLEIVKDFDSLFNWIVVRYRDELNNRDVYLTPDDNSALKDAASITTWGQRETVLDVGQASSARALSAGQRYLAAHKDPRFFVSGPITVRGYIRGKNGNPVPSSLVTAGKRVRIENFLTDEVGVSAAGLTFLISHTRYNDADETVSIDCGTPDDLAVLLAQIARAAA